MGIGVCFSGLSAGTNQISTGSESSAMNSGAAGPESLPAAEGEAFPTNAVLRLIEWKRRDAEERSILNFTAVMKNTRNMGVIFTGWQASILNVEKVSSERFVISVEIRAKFIGKGTITDTSSILETWLVDREQGLHFERRTGRKAGFIFQD